jgi:sporulation protein YlmC with PRC-barrel domain
MAACGSGQKGCNYGGTRWTRLTRGHGSLGRARRFALTPHRVSFIFEDTKLGCARCRYQFAQRPVSGAAGNMQEAMMSGVKDPSDTGGRLIAASKVNGTTVYNRAGEKLGSVYDVMVDKRSGKAEYAIMSFGGFLGIGDSYHPLPWQSLTYDEVQGGYVVDLDRSRLESAPSYTTRDADRWSDPTYGRQVNDYYGI